MWKVLLPGGDGAAGAWTELPDSSWTPKQKNKSLV